jgi:hypothetical protein
VQVVAGGLEIPVKVMAAAPLRMQYPAVLQLVIEWFQMRVHP